MKGMDVKELKSHLHDMFVEYLKYLEYNNCPIEQHREKRQAYDQFVKLIEDSEPSGVGEELIRKIAGHVWELNQELGIEGLSTITRDKFISESSNSIRLLVKQLLSQKRAVTREEVEKGLDSLIDGGMKITDMIEWLKELGVVMK